MGVLQQIVTINLPSHIASRDAADDIVAGLHDIDGTQVVVECRGLVDGTWSFADQLVKQLLVQHNVGQVVYRGAPQEFSRLTRKAAGQRMVAQHVVFVAAGSSLSDI